MPCCPPPSTPPPRAPPELCSEPFAWSFAWSCAGARRCSTTSSSARCGWTLRLCACVGQVCNTGRTRRGGSRAPSAPSLPSSACPPRPAPPSRRPSSSSKSSPRHAPAPPSQSRPPARVSLSLDLSSPCMMMTLSGVTRA
eukprot:1180864-Rhodomonas_salina.1